MTREERDQTDYEAGMDAWQACLPIVLRSIPDGKGQNDAGPWMAGYLDALVRVLIEGYGHDGMATIMKTAMDQGTEVYREEGAGIEPHDWRTH